MYTVHIVLVHIRTIIFPKAYENNNCILPVLEHKTNGKY